MATQGFGADALYGLGQQAAGPYMPSAYQQYSAGLPQTFSIYNQGSQELSAPALASLLGSVYQPQQGQAYAPGPDYYREMLDIMRLQASQGQTGANYDPLIAMLSQLLAQQYGGEAGTGSQQQVSTYTDQWGNTFPDANNDQIPDGYSLAQYGQLGLPGGELLSNLPQLSSFIDNNLAGMGNQITNQQVGSQQAQTTNWLGDWVNSGTPTSLPTSLPTNYGGVTIPPPNQTQTLWANFNPLDYYLTNSY